MLWALSFLVWRLVALAAALSRAFARTPAPDASRPVPRTRTTIPAYEPAVRRGFVWDTPLNTSPAPGFRWTRGGEATPDEGSGSVANPEAR